MNTRIEELLDLVHDYTGYTDEESREINHAVTAAREELKWLLMSENYYQQLRKEIDGGSESMNHLDAVKQVQYWQERAAQWVGMRWLPVNPTQQMERAYYEALKNHGTKNFFPVWIDLINVACANEYGPEYFPPLKVTL